jgi:hypothetical protein
VEKSTKLVLRVSSGSKWVNPMNRRNYDETSSQLQHTTMAITTKIYAKTKTYDADVVCAIVVMNEYKNYKLY